MPDSPQPITVTVDGLTFTAQPQYRRLDAYYAAHAEKLAVTVFADTIPLARERLTQALYFMAETALKDGPQGRAAFKLYLEMRGLPLADTAAAAAPAV